MTNPKFLGSSKINENIGNDSTQHIVLISKPKLFELEFSRKFTKLLKINEYKYYKNSNLKKVRFDKNTVRYLRNNNINLTYYFIKVILPEEVRNKLIKASKSSFKLGVFATNYRTLVNYF